MKNEFEKLITDFHRNYHNNPPTEVIHWGKVISVTPLEIKSDDIILYDKDIRYLEDFKKKISGGYKIDCSNGEITHNLNAGLKENDIVMMLKRATMRGVNIIEEYIIIDRVVK